VRYLCGMRVFSLESVLADDQLDLALAPGLTPGGVVEYPSFFHGFAAYPQVVARGLATLADVTATRYFQYVPTGLRDPILSAQGDRLRAECFSACNGVYARLDLLGAGFDGGDIGFGTTNVDVGMSLRQALANVGRDQLLHVDVGSEGLAVSGLDGTVHEHPVEMPDRWVRALGNAAEMHCDLQPVLTLDKAQARTFVASLPAATGKAQSGWVTLTRSGVKVAAQRSTGAAYVSGLHRLSALKRLLTNIDSLTFYAQPGQAGPVLVEVTLLAARLTLGLTDEAWRGFSGEGALLEALAAPDVLDDAGLIGSLLAFEPVIDVAKISEQAELPVDRVRSGLAVLATAGKVGWDAHDQAWFHRELPDDPDRVDKDNPRLVAGRRLVGSVASVGGGAWDVDSSGVVYRVAYDEATGVAGARCTCTWYLRHGTGRGPCKHILAVQLAVRA